MATPMRLPVVVILGATGTGKTKLSLELARRFNGEVISADSMQVYRGLDIITNKATQEERKAVPHHLIDYLSPVIEDSSVVDFRDKAVPIIDTLLDKNKLPIIVGGTNYYIESLLWKNLIDQQDVDKAAESHGKKNVKFPKLEGIKPVKNAVESTQDVEHNLDQTEKESDDNGEATADNVQQFKIAREKYERLTTPELYKQLMKVDETRALKVHPNDRRKLLRALEVYDMYGVAMSDVYKAQHEEVGEEVYSGPLRYPHTCMFWLQCEKEVLRQRLDARVDQMMEDGLVSELTEFHQSYNTNRLKEGKEADYSTGIFQSIGFKEFHTYLVMNEEERQTVPGQTAFEEGKEALKIATRRYARIQNRFVTNRILKRKGPADYRLPVYGLDSTDPSTWTQVVEQPACSILEAVIQGKKPDIEPLDPNEHAGKKAVFIFNRCAACDRVFPVEHDYLDHQKSKKHKYMMKKYKEKLAELSQTLDKRADQLHKEQFKRLQSDDLSVIPDDISSPEDETINIQNDKPNTCIGDTDSLTGVDSRPEISKNS